jgi:hypothetical protein
MRGILYVSRANLVFDEGALQQLASRASMRNATLGITGYLFYQEGKFIQYIEGAWDAVGELMFQINQDQRHNVLNIFYDDTLAKRRFPAWHMRWLQQTHFIGVEKLLFDYLVLLQDWDQQPYQQENILRLLDTLSDDQDMLVHTTAD